MNSGPPSEIDRLARITRRAQRIAILVCALVIGVVAIPVVSPFLALQVEEWRYELPFDSTSWRTRSRDEVPGWPTRLRMVDHLVRRTTLVGLTRLELTRLLGEPDAPEMFRERYGEASSWNAVYELGPDRGIMRLDAEWLVFFIGADDRVQRFAVVTD